MVALALIAIAFSHDANAEPRLVDSPECKEAANRFIEETGAEIEGIPPSGDLVFLRHQSLREVDPPIMLSCSPGHLHVSVTCGSRFPSPAWFALAATAGHAVTGEAPRKLEEAIKKCYRDALTAGEERLGGVELGEVKIVCDSIGTYESGSTEVISGDKRQWQ